MDPLVLTLRAIQGRANAKHSTAPLTWDAINNIGQTYGAPDIDYERFNARWESDPILKQLVDRFNDQGLVIKTDKGQPEPEEQGNPEMASAEKKNLSNATNAAKKALKAD